MMEQIERIKRMELRMEQASQAVMRLSAALDECEGAEEALLELGRYYGCDDWKHDFADDEAGLLPRGLKRGVLSEDAIWNLLEDWREQKKRMRELGGR